MARIDELELELEEKLLACNLEMLCELAKGVGLAESAWQGKRKNGVIKTIRKDIDIEAEDEAGIKEKEHRLKNYLQAVEEVMRENAGNGENDKQGTKKNEEVSSTILNDLPDAPTTPLADGVQITTGPVFHPTPTQTTTIPETKPQPTTIPETKPQPTTTIPQQRFTEEILGAASVFRKDFRIIGQVGEPNQKDKLTYISLLRQIDDGRSKKYSDKEIVAAVLKAIGPKSLRSYLEHMKDLSLPKLCQVLRIHYREKSATELYQELIAMKQERDETPSQFLIRALDVRECIVFAAKEDESGVAYTQETVQGLFLKTLESGLDEDISSRIRPFLLRREVSDVELIQEVNFAEESSKLRQQKLNRDRQAVNRQPKIGAVETTESSEMFKMMKEMKSQLSSLQNQVDEMKKPRRPVRRGVCADCFRQKNDRCNHCLKCGEEGHMARDCQSQGRNQGN